MNIQSKLPQLTPEEYTDEWFHELFSFYKNEIIYPEVNCNDLMKDLLANYKINISPITLNDLELGDQSILNDLFSQGFEGIWKIYKTSGSEIFYKHFDIIDEDTCKTIDLSHFDTSKRCIYITVNKKTNVIESNDSLVSCFFSLITGIPAESYQSFDRILKEHLLSFYFFNNQLAKMGY